MNAPVARALSKASAGRFAELHPDLQSVVKRAVELAPFGINISCGYRDEKAQQIALMEGKSNAAFGKSYHNVMPSLAVDMEPLNDRGGIDWNSNDPEWDTLANVMRQAALDVGVEIEWGGLFKKPVDKPHFQLGKNHPAVVAWKSTRV